MKPLSFSWIFPCACSLALLCACGNSQKAQKGLFPDNFSALTDAAKTAHMMKVATPDSVARFLCNAALGKLPGARIDTLALAAAYAYEHYNDSSLMVFSQEFDDYSNNLPLGDKMKIYSMAGTTDPQRLGYELGLEYVSHIREERMNVADVRKELDAFKEACAQDTVTFTRFMKGFKTVLRVDHGKDLPEEIYNAFINS